MDHAPERTPIRFMDTQASVLLDVTRGLAAIIVLLEHWRNILFVNYGDIASHRALWAPLYLVVSAGHQAVIIFFVLSGYLISGSVFRMLERNRWSWEMYSAHRLLRLWIVLVPAIVLTAIFDQIGMHLHREPAVMLYAGLSGNHVLQSVREVSGFRIAVGNVLFLQDVRVPTFGSNTALWSLAFEFWYYVLFPLGLTVLWRGMRTRARVIAGLLFLCVMVWLPGGITRAFPIWCMGTVLALVRPPRLGSAVRWLAGAAYVASVLAFARVPLLQAARWSDTVLGVLTFGFLWILLSAQHAANEQSLTTRGFRTLARFSFTLYATHTPLLVLIAAVVLPLVRWQPNAHSMLFGIPVLVGVIGFVWALAAVTEFRTDRVRVRIERWLAAREKLPAIPAQPAPGL